MRLSYYSVTFEYIKKRIKPKDMTLEERKLQAYNEAKEICEAYMNYKGDKRRSCYRRLAGSVHEVWKGRMDAFGKRTGNPTFMEYFYNVKI